MSKIDEFINGYSNHPMNALLAYDRAKRLNKPTDGLMVVTVDDLEQLRPYVELAEYIIEHFELIKTDWHGAYAAEFLKSYSGLILLIKQIKA